MQLKVKTAMTTQSWNISTYTNDNYLIDSASTGLSLTFPCNSPCLTCEENQPSNCITCNTFSGAGIMYNGECYIRCPGGTY